MDGITPWALCVGIFLIYPALMFVIGFYIGKNGLPFEVRISRRRQADDYGVALE